MLSVQQLYATSTNTHLDESLIEGCILMFKNTVTLHPSQLTQVLLVIFLLFALLGGTGIVVADSDDQSGQNCPEDNPTNAYNRTSDTAFTKSADGRQEALEAGECTTK